MGGRDPKILGIRGTGIGAENLRPEVVPLGSFASCGGGIPGTTDYKLLMQIFDPSIQSL